MSKLTKLVIITFVIIALSSITWGQEKMGFTKKKEVLKEVMEDKPGKVEDTEESEPLTAEELAAEEEHKDITISDILSSKSQMKRITGESRDFPYNPLKKERRDPLTIPWLKKDIDAQNMFNKGLDYKNKSEFKKAIAEFKKLINAFPDTTWANKAKAELIRLEKLIKSGQYIEGDESAGPVVRLPNELRTQLSGIIWDKDDPMVILADRLLREGDIIPELNATIVKINKSEVVYLYQKTFFRVPLIGR